MKSRVHPTYKTKYRVGNWTEYDRSLVQRGNITLWISDDATRSWVPECSGRRGGQQRYSDLAIETALTLRLIFNLPFRQAEGFLRSVLGLMRLDLEAPDHTTLSRRSRQVETELCRVATDGAIDLIVDSTGLSIAGEGEWAAAKHGGKGKPGWRKLHLGVDGAGMIVAQVLTDAHADDAATVPALLDQCVGKLAAFVADGAYDSRPVYDAAMARGAAVVVPPRSDAAVAGLNVTPCADRDRTVARAREVGRREWMKESGYHRQGAVENAFFRYKRIIGDRLRARHPKAQETEAITACNILNAMTALGKSESYAIGA
jgi:IS5 family transposase